MDLLYRWTHNDRNSGVKLYPLLSERVGLYSIGACILSLFRMIELLYVSSSLYVDNFLTIRLIAFSILAAALVNAQRIPTQMR